MDGREQLSEIMKSQGVNAKQLSHELSVSAGTISNIMSGRNKPSLELLQNIAAKYPEIQTDWLFLGKGDMYKPGDEPTIHPTTAPDLFSQIEEKPMLDTQHSAMVTPQPITNIPLPASNLVSSTRTVQKIVIFYSDGTFEER
jgi:transcriptional regulator with XRE-family HTH domain